MKHPCLSCGACCGFFRVEFYVGESEEITPGGVPSELSEPARPSHEEELDRREQIQRVMKGTNRREDIRCAALTGDIGCSVACAIYDRRPTPCRNFRASYENGKHNKRCDQARLKHGLRPLRPRDWPRPAEPERPTREAELSL